MDVTELGAVRRFLASRELLQGSEPFIFLVTLAVALSMALLSQMTGQAVSWGAVLNVIAPGGVQVLAGLLCRLRGRMPRLATFLVAAGAYQIFGHLMAMLIYMRFPLDAATIDPFLTQIDAVLGYSWPDWVGVMAGAPVLADILARVYMSTTVQLFLVLIVVAWFRPVHELHRFMLVGAMTLLITVAIWWVVPSFGPGVLHDIRPEIEADAHLVVGKDYAEELRRLATEGNPVITPYLLLGVTAFPSYHMIMAAMIAWFSYGTWLRGPALVAAFATMPATLIQGGHHAVDLMGGLVVFAFAVVVTNRLVPRATGTPGCEVSPPHPATSLRRAA